MDAVSFKNYMTDLTSKGRKKAAMLETKRVLLFKKGTIEYRGVRKQGNKWELMTVLNC